jgi:hypothetical protein
MMSSSIPDVKNWMHIFRWIVKLIRDDFDIDEQRLTRTAVLDTDLGLSTEQIEQVIEATAKSFGLRFPSGTLDEVVHLEELCLVASWLKGLYKRPAFIGADYETACRRLNPSASIEV